jgi:Lipocalin-like domain
MNRRTLLSSSAATVLGLALMSDAAVAQQKTMKEQLVGTWTFVSAIDTNKDGTKTNRWGPSAKGLAVFDANGHYSFMIARTDIPKFAANSVMQGTAEENKAVMQGLIAFFGTWSVDEATKTLITTVDASSFPNFNGKSLKRIITALTADELKYTNPATSAGTTTEAVWKRIM